MMISVKLTNIEGETGVVLPEDVLELLSAKEGDTLYVVETANGIELTSVDPEFDGQLDVAKKVMEKRRDVLKKLGG